MKTSRQITMIAAVVVGFIIIDLVIYFSITTRYVNHTSEEMQAKSIEVGEYLPFEKKSKIVKLDADVKIKDNQPVVDGAAALYPVFSAFVNSIYPKDSVVFKDGNFAPESKLQFRNTRGAYEAIVDGNADLIFCAKPSKEQLAYAKEKNVELELVPIGYEAFVFIVNKENPVDNLTVDQVREIYSGKIKKWSEVGGSNKYIDALSRNKGSGSQTAMENFMGKTKIKKNFALINGSAIGFSFRYYVEGLVGNSDVKMISLNNVYPNKENIARGKYPIVANIYAVYREGDENPKIRKIVDWILSEEGQEIVEKSGYVSLGD